jgi:hypothetical protein
MSLSMPARLTVPGLWAESDDCGVFPWKPLTLKARILPADNVDMGDILSELARADFIVCFEHDGKKYGAVKNFRKYQRPKKPSQFYPLPPELRTYVGLTDESSEPVPHQADTGAEETPQMEGGGDKVEEVKPLASLAAEARVDVPDAFLSAAPWNPSSSRHDTRGAYSEAKMPPSWEQIIAAAKRYAMHLRAQNAKRRKDDPMPAVAAQTFIRKRMWEDYQAPEALPEPDASALRAMWGGRAASLVDELGAKTFETWFAESELDDGPPMVLRLKKPLQRDYVQTKFPAQLRRAIKAEDLVIEARGVR